MPGAPKACRETQLALLPILALGVLTTHARAQYAERPDLVGSGSPAVDASGR